MINLTIDQFPDRTIAPQMMLEIADQQLADRILDGWLCDGGGVKAFLVVDLGLRFNARVTAYFIFGETVAFELDVTQMFEPMEVTDADD